MSESNRLRLTAVKETTFGTTPTTPRMRTVRLTGEGLKYEPKYINSGELRSDRMNADPVKTTETNEGTINFEFAYPPDNSPESEFLSSAMYNPWVNTVARDNDGTAASVITNVNPTGGVVTCTTGTAFAAGQLVRFSGFGVAANNGTFKCTTGSATVPAFSGAGLATEASPAAAARMKVCGFEGASGDITASASGLASTSLDFTTLGLAVGQWIKIGGTATSNKFATAACSGFARVTAISAHAITCDNLPSGWTTDSGTGKLLRVFFGDYIRNGVTRNSFTIERGFMDQATPTYIAQKGMVVGQMDLNIESGKVVDGTFTFNGMQGTASTTSLDSSPDAASTNTVMTANASVGRISENGAVVAAPNYVKKLSLTINNNLRMLDAVGTVGYIDVAAGENAVSGTIDTYFGSLSLFQKLLDGTATNASSIVTKNNQAVVLTLPRLTYTGGAPSAGGKNQDVQLPLTYQASLDTTTNCQVQFDRMEYYEA